MKIHKEGFSTIILVFGLLGLLNLFVAQHNVTPYIACPLGILSLGFFIFIVSFFRVPKRVYTYQEGALIAPADGKIVVIEEVVENEILKTPCRQISIFMSPLNVHVNRYPCNGKVVESIYHPGMKLPAFNPKSSELNERTTVVVESTFGNILFRQIAGAVARRIVVYAKQDDVAKQNEEFGFIKFGSRIDLFIPLTMKVNVELNQKVRGGQTIIASI